MQTTNDNAMPAKDSPNWRELTFSQREGHAPLPEALQAGVLTADFRNQVWALVDSLLQKGTYRNPLYYSRKNDEGAFLDKLLFSYWVGVLKNPHDKIPNGTEQLRGSLRAILIEGAYHETITFLECMLRTPGIPAGLRGGIVKCFDAAPYTVDFSDEHVCIFPVSSEENRQATKQSLDRINASDLTGAKAHLRAAAAALNDGNFAGCARESIGAVESTVHEIAPGKSEKFANALDSLKNEGVNMHAALRQALKSLYGYASNEPGIRHGLKSKDAADVGLSEAILMYSTCVAFVDYLLAKKG